MGRLVGWGFQHASGVLPVQKVFQDKEVLAFRHPRPCYEGHVLIIPRRALRDLMLLSQEPAYFRNIWEAAKALHAARPEYRDAFVLLANGGPRQDVGQVHFHLFTGRRIVTRYDPFSGGRVLFRDQDVCVLAHPAPDQEVHAVIVPAAPAAETGAYLRGVLRALHQLDTSFGIVQKGYSLVYQYDRAHDSPEEPIFHLISGKKANSI